MIGNDYQLLLIPSLVAAREAGSAILDIYETSFDVEVKDDKTPLTIADKKSHKIIVEYLSNISCLKSPIPALSEEGKDIPYTERKEWKDFWLVDPLDGTKEFIKRNGEFTVNIALIHGSRPHLGVIYIPVQDVFYFAVKGGGAYKLNGSEHISHDLSSGNLLNRSVRLPVWDERKDVNKGRSINIVGSRSHATKDLERFTEKMKEEYNEVNFVSAGSSLKFCLVAEGKADIYPRYAPTMEWDTAAGQIIAEEAGMKVRRVDNGNPLEYNKKDLKNPWFVVHNDSLN